MPNLNVRSPWRMAAMVLAIILIALPVLPVAGGFPVTTVRGQEAAGDAAAPAPQAAAGQEAAGQGEAANANGGGAATAARKSVLKWLYDSLGITYILVFLGMSFILVGLVISSIIASRKERVCPQALVDGFENLLNEKKYQDAYELAKADETFLGNVLSSGLARINGGYAKAAEAMQEAGQEESMKIQHLLSYLSLIGAIAPMVGLFGTVDGMIRAFFEIATSGGSPDPQKLADGISKALVTTLLGLAIAIPAIAAYSMLRNRFERLELEVGLASGNLMSRFENVGTRS